MTTLPANQQTESFLPEVSRFYGITVRFYYRDHPPTHFHAMYGEHEALIEIETGAIPRQQLPLLPVAPLE